MYYTLLPWKIQYDPKLCLGTRYVKIHVSIWGSYKGIAQNGGKYDYLLSAAWENCLFVKKSVSSDLNLEHCWTEDGQSKISMIKIVAAEPDISTHSSFLSEPGANIANNAT